ncbi:peptide deformylase [Streptomyces sp. NPDC088674]|uniref:peptide deformylase n=1 Tax=Streptomyces sp. NPDC088674 TaxID=3365869 RepID=UPI0038278503
MTTPGTLPPLPERVERLLATEDPLPIVAAGDPVLRTPAAPYEGQLPEALLARLLAAMRRTMREAPGVGLAAPQIGVPLRLAVLEDPATVPEEVRRVREREPLPYRVLVNPVYEGVGERRAAFYEGCLSVPGWQAVVARHAVVRLRAEDEHGRALDEEVRGWPARIVQHETDHLDGTLYVDRALPRSLTSNENLLRYWNDPAPERAAAELGFALN